MTGLVTPSADDLFYVVDDPAGSAADRSITFSDLAAAIGGSSTPVGARVYRNAVQAIPNNANTAISLTTERYDDGNLWVIGSPTRLTAPSDGIYIVTAALAFDANATGVRTAWIRLNGATLLGGQRVAAFASFEAVLTVATIWEFTAGDYVELVAFQNSGGNLNAVSLAAYSPELAMQKIA
jgi:hypothetical protein